MCAHTVNEYVSMLILEKCVSTVYIIMTLAGIGESPFNQ